MFKKCEHCGYLKTENHTCPTEEEKAYAKKLIAGANEAEELFSPDKLEFFARNWNRPRK